MLAVKGIYKDGKIELLESLEGISSADLFIVVAPHQADESDRKMPHSVFQGRRMESEEEFMNAGLHHFFDTDDDAQIDWEQAFGLKDR